jgi:hypothetical protein
LAFLLYAVSDDRRDCEPCRFCGIRQ